MRAFYPVNKNVWVFGAGNGQTFSDNSKYFFLYLLKNKTDEKPIWITQNKRVIQEIKDLALSQPELTLPVSGYNSILSGFGNIFQSPPLT